MYTRTVAKRGYTRDTIRGGASEWDVSRPFSSYLRLLGSLLAHPVRFFELLPKVSDIRAPALFLAFSGLPATVLWLIFEGFLPALAALVLPLPISFALAALYHLGSFRGRYGYVVTWRILAYPLGFFASTAAVPVLRWVGALYFGLVVMPLGLTKAQEISFRGAMLVSIAVAALLLFVILPVTLD
jgi:hypothetical protein